jgi:glycosyltransferase involved in cell wall biosynthesis
VTVCVTVEHRFERTPDGAVWTRSNHSFGDWRRYLHVFERVRVLARVLDVDTPPPEGMRADGERVSVTALPYYVGFEQFCRRWREVRSAALEAIGPRDAILLKVPSPLSCLVGTALKRQRRPYSVQVIGDAWGVFSRGCLEHPLRPLLQWEYARRAIFLCRHAAAASYVTETALQKRYAASASAFQVGISDVHLPPDAFAKGPRPYPGRPEPVRVAVVASLEQPYKGIDILLEALAMCHSCGLQFRLTIVGEGKLRSKFEALGSQLGLKDCISFTGALPAGKQVFAVLDASDLFVMPSRQEGLPRAVLEAMARATPCIGSVVGGIPELLDPEDLVEAGNASALASRILEVCSSSARLEQMSARCLNRALEFQAHILDKRWPEFFCHVRDSTAVWSDALMPSSETVPG